MRRHRPVVLLAALAFAVSACGSARLTGEWERSGQEVPESEIEIRPGPEHCGFDEALILSIVRPVDQDPSPDVHHGFVRDPEGVLAHLTAGRFLADADLPDDAEPTGYANTFGVELWLADDHLTAYLVDGDTAEAWPALDEPIICA